ncbi:hypothetical protein WG902_09675 [Ramlibacter sp. PS3R-8]|uniref:hypothetical protein n=1 Tax=Ramlibacter sp. PS3R-8 TaxID=3133437 RepID=UPI0030B4A34B
MLEIDRLRIELFATAAPRRAADLKQRVAAAVPTGIARALAPVNHGRDDSLCFIDTLAVECAVACASQSIDEDALAAEVARAFMGAYVRALASGRVRRFADRGEYLSQFWIALAEGSAARHWWFDEFEGLRPLPVSGALRTSMIEAGALAPAALARLTAGTAAQVLALLASADARRVRDAWALCEAGAAPLLAPLWERAQALADDPVAELAAVVAMQRGGTAVAPAQVLRALAALRRLIAAARALRLPVPPPASAELAEWWQHACAAAQVSACWEGSDEAQLAVAEALVRLQWQAAAAAGRSVRPADDTASLTCVTPHGGLLLLLRVMAWLGWPGRWQVVLAANAASADAAAHDARLLAFLLAARALRPTGTALLNDSILLRLLALDAARRRQLHADPAGRRALRSALQATGQGSLRATAGVLLDALADRLPGLAGSSAGYLRAQALSMSAVVALGSPDEPASPATAVVRLRPAPLDALLRLAGMTRGALELPRCRIVLEEEG